MAQAYFACCQARFTLLGGTVQVVIIIDSACQLVGGKGRDLPVLGCLSHGNGHIGVGGAGDRGIKRALLVIGENHAFRQRDQQAVAAGTQARKLIQAVLRADRFPGVGRDGAFHPDDLSADRFIAFVVPAIDVAVNIYAA